MVYITVLPDEKIDVAHSLPSKVHPFYVRLGNVDISLSEVQASLLCDRLGIAIQDRQMSLEKGDSNELDSNRG